MEARASLRSVRMAPRKIRVILDAIREQPVELALAQLNVTNKRAAMLVRKLLASAVANASQIASDIEPSHLYVKEAYADQGATLKRFQPRAMGRASKIQKKTSHVTVVVADQD